MRKLSVLILTLINSVIIANAQTLLWHNDDSTFNSSSGYLLALPHNEMYVVPNSDMGKGFSVFKYDANGAAIFRNNFSDAGLFSYSAANRITDAEGNLFVEGTMEDSVYNLFLFVSKIDTDGNQLWQLLMPVAGMVPFSGQVILDDAGDIYLTTTRQGNFDQHSDMLVYKVSNSGSLLWSRSYGDSVNSFRGDKIAAEPDGSILVAGGQQSTSVYQGYLEVLKYDTDGNLTWHHEITDDSNGDDITMRVSDLSIGNDGSIYVCGNASSLDLGMGRDYPYVVKLDSSGNKIWLKEIFDHGIIIPGVYAYYYAGTLGQDGSYYAAGVDTLLHIVVVKFSTYGDVMWVMNHLPMYSTSTGRINNIKIHNGFLFAAGSLNQLASNTDYLVIASDLSGTIQWTARFNSQNNDYNDLASLDFDNDDNVLVSGSTTKAGTNDYYTTTIKYANTANVIPSISEDAASFQVFPNPAGEDFNILSGTSSIKIKSLLISDECGRKIKEVTWSGTMEIHIDVSGFAPGIYFFRTTTEDEKLFSGKFVKQ